MNRWVGLALTLAGSLVIGFLAGQRFYGIFNATVPPAMMTDLVRAGAHTTYIIAGLFYGLVIFGWAVLVAALARFFPAVPKTKTT